MLNLDEAYDDPQLRHRGMVRRDGHAERPAALHRRRPIKLSDTPAAMRTPPPVLGEHTDAVLRDLGYTPGDIASLRSQGVIA